MSRPKPPAEHAKEAQAILEKYACPVAYHEVRMRFLGNIATPEINASPMRVLEGLWGGDLPAFDDVDAANELIGALINGLWNALTRHQKRSEPLRLVRLRPGAGLAGLQALATIRRQEIDGFIEGLFNGREAVELPEKARRAMDTLAEIRAMLVGIEEVAARTTEADATREVEGLHDQLRKLTRIIEKELHDVVLDCTRYRRSLLAADQTRH